MIGPGGAGRSTDRTAAPKLRPPIPWNSQRGFAFVMALLVALFVAGVATTLSIVSATESQITRNYRESRQAAYLAEAGVQRAIWQLSRNPADLTPLVACSLDEGTYDAVISSTGTGRYRILARGSTQSAFESGVSVEIALFPQAYNYAIATADFIDATFSADIQGAVGGASVTGVNINLATLAEMADWYIGSTVVYNGEFNFDGLVYVNGDLSIRGSRNWVEGTVVAKGSIKVEMETGYVHFASDPGMPALIAGSDILLGKAGAWAQITVLGGAISYHDMRIEGYNEVLVVGPCVANHRFEIKRDAVNPTIIWDPEFRLRPPPGIYQSVSVPLCAWVPLPNTWRILTDLSSFGSQQES